jgi:hypothetical protein
MRDLHGGMGRPVIERWAAVGARPGSGGCGRGHGTSGEGDGRGLQWHGGLRDGFRGVPTRAGRGPAGTGRAGDAAREVTGSAADDLGLDLMDETSRLAGLVDNPLNPAP